MQVFITILLIVGIALGIATTFPDKTRRVYNGLTAVRRFVFGVGVLLLGFVFIGTGNLSFMLIGTAIFLVAAWAIWFDVFDGSPPEVRY